MPETKNTVNRLLREGGAIFGGFVLLYLLLALITYSPNDPSFSNSGSDTIANWGGTVGAYIAGLLFEFTGRSAFLLCFIAVLFGKCILFPPIDRDHDDSVGWVWAVIGLVLFTISSAALEYLRFHNNEGLPEGAGGVIGNFTAGTMANWFGTFGASLLLAAIWLLSCSLVAGLSWFAFFETIGYGAEKLIKAAVKHFVTAHKNTLSPMARNEPIIKSSSPAKSVISRPLSKSTQAKREKKTTAKLTPPASPHPAVSGDTSDDEQTSGKEATLPTLTLLDEASSEYEVAQEILEQTAALIEESLASFNVTAKVAAIHPGPIVTRYDLQPETGVRGAQIVNLTRDLARALSVHAIRVLETIPGTNYIGLEIPNPKRCPVILSEILSSDIYQQSGTALPLALGKTASGKTAVADLAKMPHLLVAGSTGSGKSVFVNAVLLSLLFSRTPQQLRLLLIDPKMLELASYSDIPHLLAPVVTDMQLAPLALNWAVEEMENRYRMMAAAGVRQIAAYNQAAPALKNEDGSQAQPLPYLVVIIDELADLMMVAGKKVEMAITRLAQKARAAGIHLILATQRPSVDVITGLIKANIPCRLSFQVASKIDSRTILDQMGAETLLGMGDMLYLPSGAGVPQRLHGAYVSDDEVRRVVEHIRAGSGEVDYLTDFSEAEAAAVTSSNGNGSNGGGSAEEDPLYDQAVETVLETRRASISLVQRKLRIGYNRAARLVESMEQAGLVSPMNEFGVRKVLVPGSSKGRSE